MKRDCSKTKNTPHMAIFSRDWYPKVKDQEGVGGDEKGLGRVGAPGEELGGVTKSGIKVKGWEELVSNVKDWGRGGAIEEGLGAHGKGMGSGMGSIFHYKCPLIKRLIAVDSFW